MQRITSKEITFNLRTTIVHAQHCACPVKASKKGLLKRIPVIESDPYYCALSIFVCFAEQWTIAVASATVVVDELRDDSHSSTSRALQNYTHFTTSHSYCAATFPIVHFFRMRITFVPSAKDFSLSFFRFRIFATKICIVGSCIFAKRMIRLVKILKGITTTIELVLDS